MVINFTSRYIKTNIFKIWHGKGILYQFVFAGNSKFVESVVHTLVNYKPNTWNFMRAIDKCVVFIWIWHWSNSLEGMLDEQRMNANWTELSPKLDE